MMVSDDLLNRVHTLTDHELAWLSGYCWARLQNTALLSGSDSAQPLPIVHPESATAVVTRQVLILSGSQTGNARRIAEQLHEQLQDLHANLRLENLGDYKARQLAEEDIVLVVCSTQGEGDYPEEAISFAKFLFGKRAPDLSQLSFAVLALGDSSYPLYCEAGKQLDQRLAELGATRLFERIDCDLSYEAEAAQWRQNIRGVLHEQLTLRHAPSVGASSSPVAASAPSYTKGKPFTATLVTKQKITARTANKNVQHLEIDLGDSGISYQPGDALGVYVQNTPDIVQAFLDALPFTGEETVQLGTGLELTLQDALSQHLELTQNSAVMVKKWAELSQNSELLQCITEPTALDTLARHTPLLALIQRYPAAALSAQAWVDFLRPLTPRMYSIASSQAEVGPEVHLTLGLVQYTHENQPYAGAASAYLGLQLEEGDELEVFVEPNPRFRLPPDPSTPIIMIGSGTGIAPFRAFMQQREADEASGGAWLIFGNQRFTDDFLYQSEWQRWHKLGLLQHTHFAWSRQNPNVKTYVQHRVQEQGATLWQWLQQGAHVYVCGDANHMAKDVEAALIALIQTHGALDSGDAEAYLDQLRDERRYQRDVY